VFGVQAVREEQLRLKSSQRGGEVLLLKEISLWFSTRWGKFRGLWTEQ
jgi:hypothetical protein